MTVRIITDSASDLPQQLVNEHRIGVVPLSVRFGDKEYIDRQDLTVVEFWNMCSNSPPCPKPQPLRLGNLRQSFASLPAKVQPESLLSRCRLSSRQPCKVPTLQPRLLRVTYLFELWTADRHRWARALLPLRAQNLRQVAHRSTRSPHWAQNLLLNPSCGGARHP